MMILINYIAKSAVFWPQNFMFCLLIILMVLITYRYQIKNWILLVSCPIHNCFPVGPDSQLLPGWAWFTTASRLDPVQTYQARPDSNLISPARPRLWLARFWPNREPGPSNIPGLNIIALRLRWMFDNPKNFSFKRLCEI